MLTYASQRATLRQDTEHEFARTARRAAGVDSEEEQDGDEEQDGVQASWLMIDRIIADENGRYADVC